MFILDFFFHELKIDFFFSAKLFFSQIELNLKKKSIRSMYVCMHYYYYWKLISKIIFFIIITLKKQTVAHKSCNKRFHQFIDRYKIFWEAFICTYIRVITQWIRPFRITMRIELISIDYLILIDLPSYFTLLHIYQTEMWYKRN